MKLDFFGMSDTGRVRSANQDNFHTMRLCSNSAMCVVCDGMGGARGGNIASEIAASVFCERLKKLVTPKINGGILRLSTDSACRMLDDATSAANQAVYKKSQSSPEYSGMGTTLVGVLFCGDDVYAVNVGDSRLYLVSDDVITQITRDHSYVQHLVDSGSLTPEEARVHPFRNRITRAIGVSQKIEADIFLIELATLDECMLLLCSDGLHGMLTPEQLRALTLGESCAPDDGEDEDCAEPSDEPARAGGEDELELRVHELIEAANHAGGSDNITAVLIKYTAEQ